MAKKKKTRSGASKKSVEAIQHDDEKRKNIPTAEYQAVMRQEEKESIRVAYERRNRDLDPQLVWRGKDVKDWSNLIVNSSPLYIQEKIHPKALIDDINKNTAPKDEESESYYQPSLFEEFNGIPKGADKTEFYQHDQNWSNRMILGDALQVMSSITEREGLRGKVQCIYIDPPYGIKFNSNFQWSTTTRDVKDGQSEHITREPEQVKAFRDTWRDGIHSYLTYLRDRLTVSLDLLADSGSIFVQIGEENVHRVRALMDEVFGPDNFVSQIAFVKSTGLSGNFLNRRFDYLLWYAKCIDKMKFRRPYLPKTHEDGTAGTYSWIRNDLGEYRGLSKKEKQSLSIPKGYFLYKPDNITSQGNPLVDFEFEGKKFNLKSKTTHNGLVRLSMAGRIHKAKNSIQYVRKLSDFPVVQVSQLWTDTGTGSFTDEKVYVVQTGTKTVQRCILMTTDPGDLVLDPTCGSGTTALVAEQWGRRWITIDTSRVALTLARTRLMGAKFPYYLLADSADGRKKEAELSGVEYEEHQTFGKIRQGFVCERVPRITLGAIAHNAEIPVIWEKYSDKIDSLVEKLNGSLKTKWKIWDVPRSSDKKWKSETQKTHHELMETLKSLQIEIDKSIDRNAEFEILHDKPYVDTSKVRVSGPFTVESLSPHKMLAVDESGNHVDVSSVREITESNTQNFSQMVLENLRVAGVQQTHKEDKITFQSLSPWPGELVCAEGKYIDKDGRGEERRAAIFVGPEFGTLTRPDLVEAAREAADAGFDVLVACAFNFEAHTTEFTKLGKVPVLKARINADMHMAEDLKNTGKGNLFVLFGEPDIECKTKGKYAEVKVKGVDVFDPRSGEVRSDSINGIACWFVDTDYNEESFFVRQAYFLGANDPYKSLKNTLKEEIDEDAWASLYSDTSRPFKKPKSGRVAVKVINHLGDEVMKVIRVD